MPYTGLTLHPNQPGVDIRTLQRKVLLVKPPAPVHEFSNSSTGRSLSESIAPLVIPSSSPTRRELLNTAFNHMMSPSRKPSPLSSSPNKPSPLQLHLDDQQRNVSGIAYGVSQLSLRDAQAVDPPVMLRKKSGEIVRPVLKPKTSKSEPTTPTCAKNVHFDINLEQVRLFLRAETPAAVTGDPDDDDDDNDDDYEEEDLNLDQLKCSLPNWPPVSVDGPFKTVHVLPVTLSQDGALLIGKVQVQNIAYQKRVVVRYTFDDWETVGEAQAKYSESLAKNMNAITYDVFSFSISLKGKVGSGMAPRDEQSKMCFAVKYTVDGRDIWDNNEGRNYHVEFRRKPISTPRPSASKSTPAAEWTMDDVGREACPSSSAYSSSPDINPVAKSKFSSYAFPSSVTTTKKNMPAPSLPAQVRPAQHTRAKSSASYFGNHPAASGFSTGSTVDGFPASLYPDSYISSSMEQPMAATRNVVPIAISIPGNKSSVSEKTNPKEMSYRIFSTSPVSGSRPSPNSSSYFDFISKYCFYDSNINPYSTSPYSNSPPAHLIRG